MDSTYYSLLSIRIMAYYIKIVLFANKTAYLLIKTNANKPTLIPSFSCIE